MFAICVMMIESEEERFILAELYEKNEPILLRYAVVLLKDKYAAEDAVHNAFEAIIRHKDKYFSLPCRDFCALAVIIVKSKCIDYLRHKSKITVEQLEDMEIFLESPEVPVEEQIIFSDEYATLLKHMATLDEVSRLILEMKYVFGMSYKEIAKELNTTPKHIDTKIQRAKDKLRKIVESGGESVER